MAMDGFFTSNHFERESSSASPKRVAPRPATQGPSQCQNKKSWKSPLQKSPVEEQQRALPGTEKWHGVAGARLQRTWARTLKRVSGSGHASGRSAQDHVGGGRTQAGLLLEALTRGTRALLGTHMTSVCLEKLSATARYFLAAVSPGAKQFYQ